jgi:hypothetical protein
MNLLVPLAAGVFLRVGTREPLPELMSITAELTSLQQRLSELMGEENGRGRSEQIP